MGEADRLALVPGISSALVTTIAALLVVIPSLAGYNVIVAAIRAMIVRMDNFASELNSILDRHFVDHRKVDESLPSLGNLGAPAMPMPSQMTGNPARSTSA